MLELRPNCELCDCDLPPDSTEARICTYECTFCADSGRRGLGNGCPHGGGGFEQRPVRPGRAWRVDTGLVNDPAGVKRRHTAYTPDEIEAFVRALRDVPPHAR